MPPYSLPRLVSTLTSYPPLFSMLRLDQDLSADTLTFSLRIPLFLVLQDLPSSTRPASVLGAQSHNCLESVLIVLLVHRLPYDGHTRTCPIAVRGVLIGLDGR
jgi:hypothetical protein